MGAHVFCASCYHWRQLNDDVGECHSQPPLAVPGKVAVWPQTAPDDYCGEGVAREGGS